jgi:hypothetical protein
MPARAAPALEQSADATASVEPPPTPDPPTMGYLPNHPRDPAPLSEDEPPPAPKVKGKKGKGKPTTLAKATPGPAPEKPDPPTMGYLPANPPPPRDRSNEEHPKPLAAPRTPVTTDRLPPPKKAETLKADTAKKSDT